MATDRVFRVALFCNVCGEQIDVGAMFGKDEIVDGHFIVDVDFALGNHECLMDTCHVCKKEKIDCEQVQISAATHSDPAEYEPVCADCRDVNPRERGDDDGVEYGDPRDRD